MLEFFCLFYRWEDFDEAHSNYTSTLPASYALEDVEEIGLVRIRSYLASFNTDELGDRCGCKMPCKTVSVEARPLEVGEEEKNENATASAYVLIQVNKTYSIVCNAV